MPDFIIIGSQRCGTTSLYNYLVTHPSVAKASTKEVGFFDLNFDKGVNWYKSQFPKGDFITGEASPYYSFHPLAAERIKETSPDSKFIWILRNPVDRAYSHYQHIKRLDMETISSFSDAINAEPKRLEGEAETIKTLGISGYNSWEYQHYSYLARGIYVDQVKRWFKLFPKEQFLILKSEDFFNNTEETLKQVESFLGLSHFKYKNFKRYNRVPCESMDCKIRDKLSAYYKPYNKQLEKYLDMDFGWDKKNISVKKDNNPLVSVIISLRNTQKHHRPLKRLGDILENLTKQSIPDNQIEVIVSDIDSDPNFRIEHKRLCKKYNARYIYTKTNRAWNISKARNIGIRQAKASYIITTDVDCLFAPDFIYTALKCMDKKTIIHCRVWELPKNYTGSLSDYMGMRKASKLRDKGGYGSFQVFPRKWAVKVGGFDEEFVTWGAEDTDFYLRAKRDGLKEVWLESQADYFHQWHSQVNRQEHPALLSANRSRCIKTRKNELPVKRNPFGWGGKYTSLKDTAMLITTFLRDKHLFRCIESIRKYYPDITIYIGDNGEVTPEKLKFYEKQSCRHIELPFDAGVTATRNKLIKKVPKKYRYLAIIEDDVIFTEKSKIEILRGILAGNKKIGIAGHKLILNGTAEQHYEAKAYIEDKTYRIEMIKEPMWKSYKGIAYFMPDLILNVFLADRRVFDDCLWDEQFKSAFEHSDFFLRLKETGWRVAYVPGVEMDHKPGQASLKYKKFRNRTDGKKVFSEKWGVKKFVSPRSVELKKSVESPVKLNTQPQESLKAEILQDVVEILGRYKIKWWLEAGTCLGAVREKDFISWDKDIDIGIAPGNLKYWDQIKSDFFSLGYDLYKEWKQGKQKIELTFKLGNDKLDLFFFYRRKEFLWHGAYGPDETGVYQDFLPHVFSKKLFTNLKEITFKGFKCFLPNPPEQYLVERYGKNWRTPKENYAYWTSCKAIDRNLFKKDKIVFIGGVWDLFHAGHLNILKHAKDLGTHLIVGVLTDAAAAKYKDRPIITYKQRYEIIKSLAVVDEVIKQNNSDPTREFQKLNLHPDYLVHGDDWRSCPGGDFIEIFGGKVVFLPYTQGISSTEIKDKIKGKKKKPKHRKDKIAIGIKTFLREDIFFRCIKGIEENFPYGYKLYIADDSNIISDKKAYLYQQLEDSGHVIIRLPFNSGISAGRNKIIESADEDYILIMDDDTLVEKPISIENMKTVLDSDEEIGITAGQLHVEENGKFFGGESYSRGVNFQHHRGLLKRVASDRRYSRADDILFLYADQVANFFLAKSDVFKDCRWDNNIKIEYEHMDFFLQLAKTEWKATVCLDADAVHMKSDPSLQYLRYRRSAPKNYFLQKHNLKNVINQY